ncbi:MAG TPA: AsnC family protein [Acetobacteraceae bacterium]|nr:AsnC family protein [Acetobacteraceae bacterium]
MRATWTEALDHRLRRLRSEGRDWEEIARALGRSRAAIIERARRIGATARPCAPDPDSAQPEVREPLPAGHPDTWGALIKGTPLDGLPYPLPFFDR